MDKLKEKTLPVTRILNRISEITFLKSIIDIKNLLESRELYRGIWVIVIVLLGAVVEVLAVAAIIPVIMTLTNNELIHKSQYLSAVYKAGGFSSEDSFMMFMVIGLLFVFLFKNALSIFIAHIYNKYAHDISTNLSRRMFLKCYKKDFLSFKETNSVETINHINVIPGMFTTGLLLPTILIISECFVLTFIVSGIFAYNPVLFFSLIGVLLPTSFVIVNFTKDKLYRLGVTSNKIYEQSTKHIVQAIFGYVDVKLANKEKFFRSNYVERLRLLNNIRRKVSVFNILPSRIIEITSIFGVVVLFFYTILFVNNRDSIFLLLSMFVAASFRIMPAFGRIIASLMQIKNSQWTCKTLEGSIIANGKDESGVSPISFNESIEFRNISFKYRGSDVKAVDGISFKVINGERVGIIGESGSGKTTLMNILLRFIVEDDGGLFVDGIKLENDNTSGWRARIGYVQQDVYLLDASFKENIAFGEEPEDIDENKLRQVIEQASLKMLVESLPEGWDTNVGERGVKISGGQKQRIGIARALYKGADVLVFDEATSALDMKTESEIIQAIDNLSGKDKTIFVIAHRLTTLKGCDRIIELKDGKLDTTLDYEQLITTRIK